MLIDPDKLRAQLDKRDTMEAWTTAQWSTSDPTLQAAIQVATNAIYACLDDIVALQKMLAEYEPKKTQPSAPARQRLQTRGDNRIKADGRESARG